MKGLGRVPCGRNEPQSMAPFTSFIQFTVLLLYAHSSSGGKNSVNSGSPLFFELLLTPVGTFGTPARITAGGGTCRGTFLLLAQADGDKYPCPSCGHCQPLPQVREQEAEVEVGQTV